MDPVIAMPMAEAVRIALRAFWNMEAIVAELEFQD